MKEYFNKRNLTIAAYALGVILFAILFWLLCSNLLYVIDVAKFIFGQVRSVLYGVIFALLFFPFERSAEKIYAKIFCRKKDRPKLIKAFSIVTVYIAFLLIIAIIFTMIIPPMLTTITELRASIITSINSTRDWIESIVEDSSILLNIYNNVATYIYEELLSVDTSSLASRLQALGGKIVSEISNIVIGLIISIYFLAFRKYVGTICAKTLASVCSPEWERKISNFLRRLYIDFTEFLSARILSSLYISSITFLVCRIVGISFYPLIFLILLVLGLIPVFGPIIGAILTLTLVFITHRQHALILLITILATQIFEEFIIEPAMMKKRLRPEIGTLIVVTLISFGLFNIWGAVISVPLFCTVSAEIRTWSHKLLKKKKLPTTIESYENFDPLTYKTDGDENEIPQSEDTVKEEIENGENTDSATV